MDLFNRLIIVVFALALLVTIVVIAILPFQAAYALTRVSQALEVGITQLYLASPLLFRLAQAAVVLGAILVLGTLLVLELRSGKPRTVRVISSDGARAQVLVDSIGQRLIYHLDQLADVISVSPRVKGRGDVVDVFVEVETSPDVDIPMKSQEISHVIREVIEERMGLRLGNTDIRLKHAPYPPGTDERGVMESAQ